MQDRDYWNRDVKLEFEQEILKKILKCTSRILIPLIFQAAIYSRLQDIFSYV